MIRERHVAKTQTIVMAKKSLKSSDHREMLADSDFDRSSGTTAVSVTVIRSG